MLRGRLQFYWFLLDYHRAFMIGAFVTVMSIVGALLGLLVPDLRSVLTPASLIGLFTTLLGIGLFVRDFVGIRRAEADLYFMNTPRRSWNAASLRLSDTYSDYKLMSFGDMSAIYSPAVNALLRDLPIPYHVDNHRFVMKPPARVVAPLALRKAFESSAYLFNNPKPRLRYDPTEQTIASGAVAVLQRADYFSELCTNEMADFRISSRSDNSIRFNGIDLMANNGIILDLTDTECGCCNIIGVSTLAFTKDGYMVICVQGERAQQNPRNLAPSGSGSADWADLRGEGRCLQDFIKRATERELREECGIHDRKQSIRTELIGFCRLLHRGGLPEFFSVSFIDIDHEKLHVSNAELPYIAHVVSRRINRESPETIAEELQQYLDSADQDSFSLQLYLNLRFLIDYLRMSPESFAKLAVLSA